MYALSNADAFFQANIANTYPEGLLTELRSNLCPILAENQNWVYTHPNVVPPVVLYLTTDAGVKLNSDGGVLLLKG